MQRQLRQQTESKEVAVLLREVTPCVCYSQLTGGKVVGSGGHSLLAAVHLAEDSQLNWAQLGELGAQSLRSPAH